MSESQTHVITLPKYAFEDGLARLLGMLAEAEHSRRIEINVKNVCYWIPAAVVATLSQLNRWVADHRRVVLIDYADNNAFRYLQRMDFFERIGVTLNEDFSRREAGNAFVPIQEIPPGSATLNDEVANRLAACVAETEDPFDDLYRLCQYSLGELIANCRQHSGATGFTSAQYAEKKNMVRIGVADSGQGILSSFFTGGSPHYREDLTDESALALAMTPLVSSSSHQTTLYGRSPNRGLGLSILKELVRETKGMMFVSSGSAWWSQDGILDPKTGSLRNGQQLSGTVVSVGFERDHAVDYQGILKAATDTALKLTSGSAHDSLFT